MITVKVLLFAGIRDGIGQDQITLEYPEESTLDQLIKDMEKHYPDLLRLFRSCQFIVNCQHIHLDYLLQDNDEVAILPPLGGG